MKDRFIAFSVVIVFVIIVLNGVYNTNQMNTVIDQCEKNLPRSQKCVLTAVPESMK